mmetsp:Transcript_23282/g.20654  ORF Transcript_23282/g.20654 Transcript_23282/m.20654 type:complete len:80 (-) Transcript_23282:62-301(-)
MNKNFEVNTQRINENKIDQEENSKISYSKNKNNKPEGDPDEELLMERREEKLKRILQNGINQARPSVEHWRTSMGDKLL